MPVTNLPSDSHVLRYIGYRHLIVDADDNDKVCGFYPQALELKPKDKGCLSVTEIESFGSDSDNITLAVSAIRASLKAGAKSAFAKANVGEIHSTCVDHSVRVRIVHESEPLNPGHSCIRRLPIDNDELLLALSTNAFDELVTNASIP